MGQQLISSKQLGGGLSSEACFIITYALGRQIHLLKRLFLTGQVMQIRSRDLVPPKKSSKIFKQKWVQFAKRRSLQNWYRTSPNDNSKGTMLGDC